MYSNSYMIGILESMFPCFNGIIRYSQSNNRRFNPCYFGIVTFHHLEDCAFQSLL